jgi:hypothetical protein
VVESGGYKFEIGKCFAYLAVVKRIPLTPPKVDSATNTGIIHHMTPYNRSANVCKQSDNETVTEDRKAEETNGPQPRRMKRASQLATPW